MTQESSSRVGFVCAYTPLIIIDAAGFEPYRILPVGESPDQSGHLLHDNLCPHVKRILDRALEDDLPDLAGVIFINSCDAMRRAADAWQSIRPHDPMILIDLPASFDDASAEYLAGEFRRLAEEMVRWGGEKIQAESMATSIDRYNQIAELFIQLRERERKGQLEGGRVRLQELYNLASTQGFEATRFDLETVLKVSESNPSNRDGAPIYLFGNMLADPEVYSLLVSCGADIVGDDFCTSTRIFAPLTLGQSDDGYTELARCVLSQPPCARTFDCRRPGNMANDIVEQARSCQAQAVIGHTLKFCDPYIARLPHVRAMAKKANLPMLLLEGDCTLRSIGQQRTRIEAFIEMLKPNGS
jgi:benzoyl-CoA reductase/2-hydroxyglutaryl-CoA dehydratase subunit BcrC/BadD/HgdB